MFELAVWFVKEEVLQWIVAIIVNYVLFYYHVKVKGYKHHYLLFNFFPTIMASAAPDFVPGVALALEYITGRSFGSVVLHRIFGSIFVSWIFIPIILLIVWLFARSGRFKKPKDWVYYVVTVCLVSMIIHLYIMDPLGF